MVSLDPVDYLVIGHLTVDLTPAGPVLGGSAAYAALTARALGLSAGIVTVRGDELALDILDGIPVISAPAEYSTTFENVYDARGRTQYIRKVAPKVDFSIVPKSWRRAKIMHLAPVAQEIDLALPEDFEPSLLGLTPQGWLRSWDDTGKVSPCEWPAASQILPLASACVLSIDDVEHNEEVIEHWSQLSRLLVVTEASAGARLYWHGDSRRFRPPMVKEVDPTGAGDIFAASFFVRLLNTRDPWEAARFANRMASISVTRPGLAGVPTREEARNCLAEILE